jgi:hypothetical protein
MDSRHYCPRPGFRPPVPVSVPSRCIKADHFVDYSSTLLFSDAARPRQKPWRILAFFSGVRTVVSTKYENSDLLSRYQRSCSTTCGDRWLPHPLSSHRFDSTGSAQSRATLQTEDVGKDRSIQPVPGRQSSSKPSMTLEKPSAANRSASPTAFPTPNQHWR